MNHITREHIPELLELVMSQQQVQLSRALWDSFRISRYDRVMINLVRTRHKKARQVIPITPITKTIRYGWVNLELFWTPGAIIRRDHINAAGLYTLIKIHNNSSRYW